LMCTQALAAHGARGTSRVMISFPRKTNAAMLQFFVTPCPFLLLSFRFGSINRATSQVLPIVYYSKFI
jgi:hypothetical protein